jgi:hypothetical protein
MTLNNQSLITKTNNMKQILVAVFFATLFTNAFAQSERYAGAMQKNMEAMDNAKSPADMHDLSNAFERIGDAEKNQWLPYYYAAMSEVLNGFMITDKTGADVIADRAELLINKADALEVKNSEITCVKSMIAMLRMMVDPMQRWQQYGALSAQLLEEAKQQDPSNPRPFALQAQNLFYTPAQFGGGCTTAKPVAEEGAKLLNAFKAKSPLHPIWGKTQFDMVLGQCK